MHSLPFFAFVTTAGALLWLMGVYSERLKAYVAPPLVLTLAGILLGLVIPHSDEALIGTLETLAWLSVGFGVTGIALRFTRQHLQRIWSVGALITAFAMIGMWGVSTLLVWWITGLPMLLSLLIGAIVTPTDPVVASSIVTGPFAQGHIPERLRYMLSFESGVNDGLAYAFVFLAVLLLQMGQSAWAEWASQRVAWGVLTPTLIGAALGLVAGFVHKRAIKRGYAGAQAIMLTSIALTVLVLGFMKLLAVDSIWSAFVAGLVFTSILAGREREAADQFEENGTYLAMTPALLVFGMVLPWDDWGSYGVTGAALVVALLVLRRIPIIAPVFALLRRPIPNADERQRERHPLQHRADWLFYGWFGPIGLSAIYYATTAHRHLQDDQIWSVSSLVIFASIVAHGLTASPFTRLYAKWLRREPA